MHLVESVNNKYERVIARILESSWVRGNIMKEIFWNTHVTKKLYSQPCHKLKQKKVKLKIRVEIKILKMKLRVKIFSKKSELKLKR